MAVRPILERGQRSRILGLGTYSARRRVNIGSWRPAIGNSDTHLAAQLGTPQTVVMADDLTAPSILSGLRAGRSWIAESASVDLSFNVVAGQSTAGIGEYIQARSEPVVVRATVSGVPAGLVTLHTH